MFPSSWLYLLLSDKKSNPESDIRCPLCGERLRICRNGHYWRYWFDSDDKVAVQRYGCRNPGCPRKTFSIPPHPLLPFCRIPLCLLMMILKRHRVKGYTVSRCARWLKRSWNTAKRALSTAARLLDWFIQESGAGAFPNLPCRLLAWPAFTRAYSYAFFPGRQ